MLTSSQLLQIGLLRLGGGGFGYACNFNDLDGGVAYIPYPGQEWSYLPEETCWAALLVNPNDVELEIKLVNPSTRSIFLPSLRYIFIPGLSNLNQVLMRRKDLDSQSVPVLFTRFR